jgi:anti-sigma B factor antagonist
MRNTLTFREEDDVVVVDVRGMLTVGRDSIVLRATLRELTEAGYKNVLLNMARVTYVDIAGIGELVAGYTSLARVNGTLKLLNLQKSMKDVFRTTGMDSVFDQYEEESAAILSFYSAKPQQPGETWCVGLPSDAYLG